MFVILLVFPSCCMAAPSCMKLLPMVVYSLLKCDWYLVVWSEQVLSMFCKERFNIKCQ